MRRGSPAGPCGLCWRSTLLACAAVAAESAGRRRGHPSPGCRSASSRCRRPCPAATARSGSPAPSRNTSTEHPEPTCRRCCGARWTRSRTAEGMDGALASAANDPLGAACSPARLFENIPSDADRTLAPGEATEFDLTADIEDFELPEDDAVYLIGVQVRGRVGASGDDEILGRGRIFMPLVDGAGAGSDTDPARPGPDSPRRAPRPTLRGCRWRRWSCWRAGRRSCGLASSPMTTWSRSSPRWPAADSAGGGPTAHGQLRRRSRPHRGARDDARRLRGRQRQR